MPTYEFRCAACEKEFSRTMSIAEHERTAVVCPDCNQAKVTQKISSFTARTSRKS